MTTKRKTLHAFVTALTSAVLCIALFTLSVNVARSKGRRGRKLIFEADHHTLLARIIRDKYVLPSKRNGKALCIVLGCKLLRQ